MQTEDTYTGTNDLFRIRVAGTTDHTSYTATTDVEIVTVASDGNPGGECLSVVGGEFRQ